MRSRATSVLVDLWRLFGRLFLVIRTASHGHRRVELLFDGFACISLQRTDGSQCYTKNVSDSEMHPGVLDVYLHLALTFFVLSCFAEGAASRFWWQTVLAWWTWKPADFRVSEFCIESEWELNIWLPQETWFSGTVLIFNHISNKFHEVYSPEGLYLCLCSLHICCRICIDRCDYIPWCRVIIIIFTCSFMLFFEWQTGWAWTLCIVFVSAILLALLD